MAAIDFPNSPSVGTIHTVDNKRWEYDAEKWILLVDYITPNVSGTVYNATIGDGTNTSYVVSHNFNSRDVSVTARQAASPYGLISASWEATTTNAITLSFNSAPSASSVRVSVYIAVAGLEVGATGATGPTGPAGMVIQGTAPIDTTVIWADTSPAGVAVVPTGGTTGQVLAKASSTSYDTVWSTPVTSADLALKANLASPALTGTPTAPTATAATNTTQIATTEFVRTEVANLIASAPGALDTLDELALALGDDANFATTTATAIGLKAPLASPTFTGTVSGITKTMVGLGSVDNTADTAKPVSTAQQTALDLKASLASPALTGTPTAPTATAGTNTTQLATTEFVTTAIPAGVINPYGGSSAPTGWLLCYGQAVSRTTYAALFAVLSTTYNTGGEAGTDFRLPDLRGRVVAGLDNMGGTDAARLSTANTLGTTTGTETITLTSAEMPSHTHTQDAHSHSGTATEPATASFMRVVAAVGTNLEANHMAGRGSSTHADYNNATMPQHSHNLSINSNTATNQNTGGGGSHNNMQPTMVLNYIIKA